MKQDNIHKRYVHLTALRAGEATIIDRVILFGLFAMAFACGELC
jgi:hypothetical protein